MTDQFTVLDHFTDAVEGSLELKNWYSALILSLTLPDICSKIESPETPIAIRYPNWFNRYVTPTYTIQLEHDRKTPLILNGDDAYALNCLFSHQTGNQFSLQKARDILMNCFINPAHNTKHHSDSQHYIHIFCLDVLKGVNKWMKINEENNQRKSISNKLA